VNYYIIYNSAREIQYFAGISPLKSQKLMKPIEIPHFGGMKSIEIPLKSIDHQKSQHSKMNFPCFPMFADYVPIKTSIDFADLPEAVSSGQVTFGRTALCLSGGGGMAFQHFGVIEELLRLGRTLFGVEKLGDTVTPGKMRKNAGQPYENIWECNGMHDLKECGKAMEHRKNGGQRVP